MILINGVYYPSKKAVCLENPSFASHRYYQMECHAIEYGINDYIYISEVVQREYCGEKTTLYHRLKIHYDGANGELYVNMIEMYYDGSKARKRRYLGNFIRKESQWY